MGAPAADAKLQRQEAHTNGCLAAVAATANGDAYCTPTELTHREASKSVDASLPLKPARIRKRRAEPGRARAGSEGETARKEERRVGRREGRDGERKTTSPACQGKKRSTESVYGGSVKAKTDTVSRFLHCASTPYRSADDWGRCSQALEYRPVRTSSVGETCLLALTCSRWIAVARLYSTPWPCHSSSPINSLAVYRGTGNGRGPSRLTSLDRDPIRLRNTVRPDAALPPCRHYEHQNSNALLVSTA